MTATTTTNAYWAAVQDHLEPDSLAGGALVVDNYGSLRRAYDRRCDRHALTSTYSWTVTDPATVEFVRDHCGPIVVDPLAGSGWWAWLLEQGNVDVYASDENPPDGTDANQWHRGPTHLPVKRLDGAQAVAEVPVTATLLLSWPPMDDAGFRILSAYRGNRVIYIGEGWGGCTGDDDLFELLQRDWTEVAEHMPVQFYGLHDFVTVYDRKEAIR